MQGALEEDSKMVLNVLPGLSFLSLEQFLKTGTYVCFESFIFSIYA